MQKSNSYQHLLIQNNLLFERNTSVNLINLAYVYTSRQTKFILIQKLKIVSEKVLVDSVRREGYMFRSCGGGGLGGGG